LEDAHEGYLLHDLGGAGADLRSIVEDRPLRRRKPIPWWGIAS